MWGSEFSWSFSISEAARWVERKTYQFLLIGMHATGCIVPCASPTFCSSVTCEKNILLVSVIECPSNLFVMYKPKQHVFRRSSHLDNVRQAFRGHHPVIPAFRTFREAFEYALRDALNGLGTFLLTAPYIYRVVRWNSLNMWRPLFQEQGWYFGDEGY